MLNGNGNCVIEAVAGSGKSTTIVNSLKLIPNDKRVLFLAFNKSIVEELKIKVGNLPNVEIKTLHSLGCSALFKQYHSRVNADKYTRWLNDCIKYNAIEIEDIDEDDEDFPLWKSNVLKLMDLGRANLTKDMSKLYELADKHDIDIVSNEIDIAIEGINYGEGNVDEIDFTDMIYLPVVKNLRMFQYDWVLIDECQDLNSAQRNLFLKCKKSDGRFIAVGDKLQAIYGFAGADVESFKLLQELPNTITLPLSICYRCDADIIELAKEIVPQIEARPKADKGVVTKDAKLTDVKDGDMILCRVTAPLVSLCINYISNGRKAFVKGKDIGQNLANMIKRAKKDKMSDVFKKFEGEKSRTIKKVMKRRKCNEKDAKESTTYATLIDKINAIKVIADGLTKATDVMSRIDAIFSDERKGICLSTIHKAKGLESDNVFIIRDDKFYLKQAMKKEWSAEQEKNLVYVAYTRAKHYLGFIPKEELVKVGMIEEDDLNDIENGKEIE